MFSITDGPRPLPEPTPERYTNEADLTESLERKGTPEPGRGLYPRDGCEEVTEVEEALSRLTIPGQEFNVVVSSGMAAVGGAVRYALQLKGRELDGEAPTLAHPPTAYTQSTRTFENLRYMGVSAVGYNPGDTRSVNKLFADGGRRADVIFAETVSNTPDATVLDVPNLLSRAREIWDEDGDDGPILVLDNTMPLSTGIDFSKIINEDDRVLVAESSTKGPLHNSGHLGVVYSPNGELICGFRKHKVTEGLVTSTGADATILAALEATMPDFHPRNRALYRSTGIIATWLAAAQQAQGGNPEFSVAFPELPDHPNHEYAERELTNGVSPVVFLDHAPSAFEEDGARNFLREVSEHPAIREQIAEGQVYLGQSFGFPEATLLYDPSATQIRVSGGYDIDSHALGKALFQALLKL